MTSSHLQYALNSGAWFLGGCVVSSIYWRVYFHRKTVKAGGAKEQPLPVFVSILVVLVTAASVLLAEVGRLELAGYVQCQGTVNQQFRDGYQDRVVIAAQDRRAIDEVIKGVLYARTSAQVQRVLQRYLNERAGADQARARSPVVVDGHCHPPARTN